MSDPPIYVTKPFLPPLEEFVPYLERIWESHIVTNGGPFHEQLEEALCEYLGLDHVALFANGTLALMTALQALEAQGEVITTPYSFVATAHALLWNGLDPVFTDIDPVTLNLDPSKIEAAITSETAAILPVHCYGNPCDVDAIQAIADRHKLPVLYDAAHTFGVRDEGGSIVRHGDLSILSFHATKVFNTFEGGAVICPSAEMKERVNRLKNFGIIDDVTVVATGMNAKMNEVSAAMGLLQLEYVDDAIQSRRSIDATYRELLSGIRGIHCLEQTGQTVGNYAYFPILVGSGFPLSRDDLFAMMKTHGVFGRRYFYPLISEFPMYRDLPSASTANLSAASRIAAQVLCLPIYPTMSDAECRKVATLVAEAGA